MTASPLTTPTTDVVEPRARCCERHPDWPTLAQHLVDAFPDATIGDVVRELRHARDAVTDMGVQGDDALDVVEAIARNQLNLLTNRIVDGARLDPERHRRTGPRPRIC